MNYTLKKIKKTKEYLDYLEEHINYVIKAWDEIKLKCKDMNFICDDFKHQFIEDEVFRHDASKLSKEEFIQYAEWFYPTGINISTRNIDRKRNFKKAWDHHKERNLHHWENISCISDVVYAELHVVHMVIDWHAMGLKFGDNAKKYYEKNKDKITLPKWAVKFIYEIFDRLYAFNT